MMSGLRGALFLLALFASSITQVSFGLSSDYWTSDCFGPSYTGNHVGYQSKLKLLAQRLPEQVASSRTLYASVTIGSFADKLYAVGQCRGDINATNCQNCTTEAIRDVQTLCGFKRRVVIYYSICKVALADVAFHMFPMDSAVNFRTVVKYNNSETTIERNVLDTAIATLTKEVAMKTSESARHFVTGELPINGTASLYGMAECLPSISSEDCQVCLQNLISENVIEGLIGEQKSMIWCGYRYELFQFFNASPMLHLPAPRSEGKQDNVSPPAPGHHRHHKHVILIVIVVAAVVVVLIIIALIIWWRMNGTGRKKSVKGKGEEIDKDEWRSALTHFQEILHLAKGRKIALFLDYEGTLSRIVKNADKAYMSEQMREVVREVSNLFDTAVVSGRSRQKVQKFVKLQEISYAGSHGLDILVSTKKSASSSGGRGMIEESEIMEESGSFVPAAEFLPVIRNVIEALEAAVTGIKGASVEDNKFTATVHYRKVHKKHRPQVRRLVEEVLGSEEQFGCLRLTSGKKVWEIHPPIKWNKGDAVEYLLGKLGLGNPQEVFPIYIGDDTTDEDAFKVLRDRGNGIGIVVSKVIRQTHAYFWLKNPAEVKDFLGLLVQWKADENPPV